MLRFSETWLRNRNDGQPEIVHWIGKWWQTIEGYLQSQISEDFPSPKVRWSFHWCSDWINLSGYTFWCYSAFFSVSCIPFPLNMESSKHYCPLPKRIVMNDSVFVPETTLSRYVPDRGGSCVGIAPRSREFVFVLWVDTQMTTTFGFLHHNIGCVREWLIGTFTKCDHTIRMIKKPVWKAMRNWRRGKKEDDPLSRENDRLRASKDLYWKKRVQIGTSHSKSTNWLKTDKSFMYWHELDKNNVYRLPIGNRGNNNQVNDNKIQFWIQSQKFVQINFKLKMGWNLFRHWKIEFFITKEINVPSTLDRKPGGSAPFSCQENES
jgi:hypothetical protein